MVVKLDVPDVRCGATIRRTNSYNKLSGMYERTLHQILQVLRRIKCLTYAMLLITSITLVLYLVQDILTINITTSHTILPLVFQEPGTPQDGISNKVCEKPTNIIFTKTHKTGSSTLSNILLRYSEIHQLTQLLYSYPSSTEYKRLKGNRLIANRKVANIFTQHANYDMDFLKEHIHVQPKPKVFTILRNPMTQFISAYSFFEKTDLYPADSFEASLELFLNSHSGYLKQNWFCKNCDKLVNANAADLGFNFDAYTKSNDRTAFMKEFLESRRKLYDLVLITEYFDLSLVLLKRRFCLSYDEIIYLRSLEQIKKEKVTNQVLLDKIHDIQEVDVALYDYFNKTFWEEIDKEEGIFDDLHVFQNINKMVQSFCIQGNKIGYKGTYENRLSDEGRKNFYCLAMNTRCLPFSQLLQARDDEQVSDDVKSNLIAAQDDEDSLNFRQILTMNKHTDIVDLAIKRT